MFNSDEIMDEDQELKRLQALSCELHERRRNRDRKKKQPKEHWYAGKRYKDQSTIVVYGTWEKCCVEFQWDMHSRFRRFETEEEAHKWVSSLPHLEWPAWNGMREDGMKTGGIHVRN
jgi:hypothetical protein